MKGVFDLLALSTGLLMFGFGLWIVAWVVDQMGGRALGMAPPWEVVLQWALSMGRGLSA